ncbi:MAG: hypothetical protein PHD88_08525 [Firmicutes bacterium]|nr:hypothetical protein [Bacillota bacterium]MDD4694421.1 hypothetical protein [Bacillota bacterium]
MMVELGALHWVYLSFIVAIIAFMIMRKDTSFVCIIGIAALGLLATRSISGAAMGIFNGFAYAITELLGTILIISIIVAMSKVLADTGVNGVMVAPFTKLIRTPTLAYWVIGIVMMIISWFFWPSPAVPLVGAILLPVALKVGLPALGIAVAMNLFGHGIALSGDFIIQGAPKLTADAAGIPVGEVITASVPLVIVMGVVTTVIAFILLIRDIKRKKLVAVTVESGGTKEDNSPSLISKRAQVILAILVPALFIMDLLIMVVLKLQGGDATALIGGTAVLILVGISLLAHKDRALGKITEHLIEGLQFGFRVFGPVIPIAAFFYLGDAGFLSIFGNLLPATSQGLVNDIGLALAHAVPLNSVIGAVTLTIVGAITGLDGSGFSGISLAGSVGKVFAVALETSPATLTAMGQISAIWVGGGTLIPWAVIPAAAICEVDPFELARRNLIPVIIGLAVTTVVAMFLI